jgi:hypothetical protein
MASTLPFDITMCKRHHLFAKSDLKLANECLNNILAKAWELRQQTNQHYNFLESLSGTFENEQLHKKYLSHIFDSIDNLVWEFDSKLSRLSEEQLGGNYPTFEFELIEYAKTNKFNSAQKLGPISYDRIPKQSLSNIFEFGGFFEQPISGNDIPYYSFEYFQKVTPKYMVNFVGEYLLLHWTYIVSEIYYLFLPYPEKQKKHKPSKEKGLWPNFDPMTLEFIKIMGLMLYYTTANDNHENNSNTSTQELSYKWISDKKGLDMLFKRMIGKYIDKKTTFEQFSKIFSGLPPNECQPLIWHNDNLSELIYFNLKLLPHVNITWAIYKRMLACFVKSSGSRFSGNCKSLASNIEINLSPQKQEEIASLFNALPKP